MTTPAIRTVSETDDVHIIEGLGYPFGGPFNGSDSYGTRFKADTINIAPGQRYDVIWTALKPGKWLIHCHIGHHTTNNNVESKGGGGLMVVIDVT